MERTQRIKNKRILIMDYHRGTSLSHREIFERLGFQAELFAFNCQFWTPLNIAYKPLNIAYKKSMGLYRNKMMYFFDIINRIYYKTLFFLDDRLFKRRLINAHAKFYPFIYIFSFGIIKFDHFAIYNTMKDFIFNREILPKAYRYEFEDILDHIYFKKYFSQFDYFFCSFPPVIFQFVKIIADKYDKKMILNIGHRFNIHIQTLGSNEKIKKDLVDLSKSKKHILGVASEYDYHYVKYYLNLNLKKLYIKTFQVPLSRKVRSEKSKNTILVGCANGIHEAEARKLFNSKLINAEYELYCKKNNLERKFTFKTIREEFTHYDFEDLANYSGFIVIPYSSFSISGLELYEYNLPYFYPSVKLLKKYSPCDCILYPTYCTKERYMSMENDIDDDDSPNNYSNKARDKWLRYFSGYQHENSIIFDNLDDLFEKINHADENFEQISENMFLENKKEREELLNEWKKVLL